jgi:hypothetical protein
MPKNKFGGIFFIFEKIPKKWKTNCQVFETIKLNKKLIPRIQFKNSNWTLAQRFI